MIGGTLVATAGIALVNVLIPVVIKGSFPAQIGLMTGIYTAALQVGQLQRVLERRFEHATAFDGCFVFLDAKGSLVIWHALPSCGHSPADTLSRMLSLARLEALDVHRAP